MTRERVIQEVKREIKAAGVKIYIGRNGAVNKPGYETLCYTDDFEDPVKEPYFYGPEGGFQMLYPHAKPIGVIKSGDKEVFWSDLKEVAMELTKPSASEEPQPQAEEDVESEGISA